MLGQGYSIGVNTFYPSCLEITNDVPNLHPESTFDSSFDIIDESVPTPDGQDQVRRSEAVLRFDRYYNTLHSNTNIELKKQYKTLLQKGNVNDFFSQCGSSFIQSIRRTAEIRISVTYTAGNDPNLTSTQMDNVLNSLASDVYPDDGNFNSLPDTQVDVSLTGVVFPRSMTGNLVVNSRSDFNEILDFTGRSMLEHPDSGLPTAINALSWINFPHFFDFIPSLGVDSTDSLSRARRKMNLMENAEFILKSDKIIAVRDQNLLDLDSCLNQLNDISDKTAPLSNRKCVGCECDLRNVNTLYVELLGEEPSSAVENRFLSGRKSNALNNIIANMYQPCIAQLTRDISGIPQGMMYAVHWAQIPQCAGFLSCEHPDSIFEAHTGNFACIPPTIEDENISNLVAFFCPATIGSIQEYSECWQESTLYDSPALFPSNFLDVCSPGTDIQREHCGAIGSSLGGTLSTSGGTYSNGMVISVTDDNLPSGCLIGPSNEIYFNESTNGSTNDGYSLICRMSYNRIPHRVASRCFPGTELNNLECRQAIQAIYGTVEVGNTAHLSLTGCFYNENENSAYHYTSDERDHIIPGRRFYPICKNNVVRLKEILFVTIFRFKFMSLFWT